MRMKSLALAAGSLSLIATPVLANPAGSLSIANAPSARAASPMAHGNKLAGSAIVPVILALAIVAGGIYIAADDKSKPKSP